MRILQIIQCTELGGMEQCSYLLMQALQGHGYEFRAVSLHPLGKGKNLLARMGVPAVGCPYRGKFGLLSHHILRREVKRGPADLVMVVGPSVSSCLAAKSLRDVPKVLGVHYHHGTRIWDQMRWAVFYAIFARDYAAIIFNTDFARREAERIYPPIKEKAVVAPVPIKAPALPSYEEKRAARSRLGLSPRAVVIGNAGWLIPRKRFDVLLQVAAALKEDFPTLQILVAGGGEMEAPLKGLAMELGLGGRVHWLGWQEDLHDFYTALDVLVFNSEADALGRTPLEAMAYGVPVVASVRYGGLGETLKHGENGFLLSEHDVERLKTLCARLLSDPKYAHTIGLRGRETIKYKHSIEQYAQTHVNIFQRVNAHDPNLRQK